MIIHLSSFLAKSFARLRCSRVPVSVVKYIAEQAAVNAPVINATPIFSIKILSKVVCRNSTFRMNRVRGQHAPYLPVRGAQ